MIDLRSSSPPQGGFDADGGAIFRAPQGSYVLVARLDIDTDPETILWRKKSLVVSDANVESIKILLGPGVNVGGRIRIEGKTHLDVSNRKACCLRRAGSEGVCTLA